MRGYLSLVPISAKVHKRQNRLTLISIILSVFLITAIFSMAEIWQEGELNAMIKKHGSHHYILKGISESDAEKIKERADVAAFAWCNTLNEGVKNKAYHIGDKNLILYGTEQSYISEIRNWETEGFYPQNNREVMLSADAKEELNLRIGNFITVSTPAGDFEYTISGFCADDTEYNASIDGVCMYLNADGFGRILEKVRESEAEEEVQEGAEEEEAPAGAEDAYYIRFAEKTKLKTAIADLKAQHGLTDRNVKENTSVLTLMGESGRALIESLYYTMAIIFFIILITGVLMISSCMNSLVSQKTKFFGMMRCIGASRKQVMHFVRFEALNWCKTAVPIGCILGTAVTWIMCIFLKEMVGGEFADLSFRFSLLGVVSGAAIGVCAVLLAARSPAKKAADVSPMMAVAGNTETGKNITHGAKVGLFKVETALGIHHATAAKKNLILMTLSFAFTVTLFFCFSAFLEFAQRFMPSASNFTPDASIVSDHEGSNTMDKSLAEKVAGVSGVERVFGNATTLKIPAKRNGADSIMDLVSYDDFMLEWSKKSVLSGDISKIEESPDYVLTIYNQDSRLDVGDKIEMNGIELEVVCVLSEGVGGYGRPLIISTEETFSRITGDTGYMLLNMQFTKDATDKTIGTVRALSGEHLFVDRREENKTVYSSYWVFRIAAYGFLAIITLITVFNIMNNISMSVSARIKLYGSMRAVGMSVGQVTEMIAVEAAAYALCGLFFGCAAGLFLHRFLIIKLIAGPFGGRWRFPADAFVIIVLIVALSCVAAVYAPAKRIRNMQITDTINEL